MSLVNEIFCGKSIKILRKIEPLTGSLLINHLVYDKLALKFCQIKYFSKLVENFIRKKLCLNLHECIYKEFQLLGSGIHSGMIFCHGN